MSVASLNRELTKDVLTELDPRSPFEGHCTYCGGRCYGRACHAHSDLTLIEQRLLQGESHDPTAESLVSKAAGSQRKEIVP